MKKTFKVLAIMLVFVCYCFGMGVSNSNVAHAALSDFIMNDYYGSYRLNGNETSGDWFYIYNSGSSINSVFRGEYPETTMIACSNFNSYDSTFSPKIIGDNITLVYKNWARLEGDGFVPQTGKKLVIGYLRFEDNTAKIRIGYNTYIRV